MQEAAERTFSPPPCFSLLPFHLFPSTLQGHCWPSHCGPACTLLWFCFKRDPSRLFKPGYTWNPKAVLYMHTFSLLYPRKSFLWNSQLHRMFELFLAKNSRFGYCNVLFCGLAENHPDTFVFFQNSAMKILSTPCCSDHIPLPCFSSVVTSVSHIQNKHCAFCSRFLSWLDSNLNITSPATKMYF